MMSRDSSTSVLMLNPFAIGHLVFGGESPQNHFRREFILHRQRHGRSLRTHYERDQSSGLDGFSHGWAPFTQYRYRISAIKQAALDQRRQRLAIAHEQHGRR